MRIGSDGLRCWRLEYEDAVSERCWNSDAVLEVKFGRRIAFSILPKFRLFCKAVLQARCKPKERLGVIGGCTFQDQVRSGLSTGIDQRREDPSPENSPQCSDPTP